MDRNDFWNRLDDRLTRIFMFVQMPVLVLCVFIGGTVHIVGMEHGDLDLQHRGIWIMAAGLALASSTPVAWCAFHVGRGSLRLFGRLARAMEEM